MGVLGLILLADLDYLVCCLPGTRAIKGIVNADFISALPNRAWLVNIGRGSNVDELALVNALNNGSLAGAILDVFREEPFLRIIRCGQHPTLSLLIILQLRNYPPDIASIFIKNYKRFIQGKPLLYQVDFEQGY